MDLTNEQIVVKAAPFDGREFVDSFREAVLTTFMLLFERRALDLTEEQLYSLHQLAYTARQMQVQRFLGPPANGEGEQCSILSETRRRK